MPRIHPDRVPPNVEIIETANGARYFWRNGQKVYITTRVIRTDRTFKPRRGAFLRFIENQSINI